MLDTELCFVLHAVADFEHLSFWFEKNELQCCSVRNSCASLVVHGVKASIKRVVVDILFITRRKYSRKRPF